MKWIRKLWMKDILNYNQKEELENIYNKIYFEEVKRLTEAKAKEDAKEYMR
jgi:hypothetical protein